MRLEIFIELGIYVLHNNYSTLLPQWVRAEPDRQAVAGAF